MKPNHFDFCVRKCKQNKYGMNDVVAQGGMITAMDRMQKIIFFSVFASDLLRYLSQGQQQSGGGGQGDKKDDKVFVAGFRE